MAAKKKSAAKKKNSLVENINKRKRAGKSRPKSRSKVSEKAYGAMEQGWPKKGTAKKGTAKKRATKKRTTKKRAATLKE